MKKKKHDKHARLSCSGSERWIACPPSIAASEGIRRQSSAAAEEGTMAHSVLESMLMLHYSADDVLNYESHEGVEVPEDMRHAVARAINYVHRWEAEHPQGQVLIEEEVNPGQCLERDDLYGTADLILIDASTIEVIDYKHGKGKRVSAKGNPQMRLYAVGALMAHLPRKAWRTAQVTMTIIQPRMSDFDEQDTTTGAELLDWMESTVSPAAQASEDINGPRASGSHCHFCPVSGTCRELTHKMFKVAAMEFAEQEEQEPQNVGSMTPEEVHHALTYASLMSAWLEGLYLAARDMMLDGHEMEGFKLVYKAKHKKWDDQIAAVLQEAELPLDTYMPRSPLAVGGLFQQLKRDKVPHEVVDTISQHVVNPVPEVAVAAAQDKRHPVAVADYGTFKEH